MANKTVYTLDLDTSKLINKYKGAINEMEKAGVSTDITKGLSKSLEKLEKEYQSLENAGKAGFTNSKQIESFQKKVEKLMASFRGFETELGGVSEKIGKVAEKSDKAGKKLQSAFSKLGFKDAAKAMNDVVNATDKEAKLSELVESELKDRAKAVSDLKAQYEAAAKAAEQAAAKAGNAKLGTTLNAKAGGKNIWTSGQNKPDESTRKAIAAQAEAIAKSAQDGQAAWQQFTDYLKANGLDKVFNSKAMPAVEQTIRDMQSGYAAAAPAIEAAAKAQEQLNAAEESFSRIGKQNKDGTIEPLKGAMRELSSTTNEYVKAEEQIGEVMTDSQSSVNDMNKAQQQAATAAENVAGAAAEEDGAISDMTAGLYNTVNAAEKTASSFEQLKQRVLMFFSVTSIFSSIRNEIKKTYNDVKELDKSFASIAMVTNYGIKEMWQSYGQYTDMAAQLGQKTNDVIKASALFYQQGLDTNEALALTTDTMKLATLAGNDFQTATQEMTSAIRGFKMEMDEGGRVTDVYSELAAHAAASVDDIAQAMARTASIANSAGMSFENTSAFLTQMIETTQESAENIGTSLKTIIARFTELKENVAGTSDSQFEDLDYNKVDKALKSVGVSLKDATGQFRNLDEVFLELSQKWDTLDRNTQRYVATIAAGSRQQSRFIAMMDNYDRTVELMEYAADAEGKADEQFAKYADTMEYKLNQLQTKWEEFRVNLLDSEAFKTVIDLFTSLVDHVNNIKIDSLGDVVTKIGAIGIAVVALKKNIMSLVTGFGSIIKTSKDLGKTIGTIFKQKFTKKPVKLQLEIDKQKLEKELADVRKKIEDIKKNYGDTKFNFLIEANTEDLNKIRAGGTEAQETLKNLGITMVQFQQYEHEAEMAGTTLDAQMRETNALYTEQSAKVTQLKDAKVALAAQEKKSQVLSSLASSAFSSLTSSIMMYASGAMSATEAIKSFLTQFAVMAIQLVVQTGLEYALAKAKAVSTAAAAAEAKEKGLESAAHLANAAAEATEAAATYALILPVLILVATLAALAIAITLIISLMAKSAKAEKEASDASKQHAKAVEQLKEAQEKLETDTNELKDLQSQEVTLQNIKDEYDTLIQKKIRTTKEEERLKELQEEILNNHSELIVETDEEGNVIKINNTLLDSKLDKIKEELALKKEIVALDQAQVYSSSSKANLYKEIEAIGSAMGGESVSVSSKKRGIEAYNDLVAGNSKLQHNANGYGVYTNNGSTFVDYNKQIEAFRKKLDLEKTEDLKLTEREARQNDLINAYKYAFGDNSIDPTQLFGSADNQEEVLKELEIIKNNVSGIKKKYDKQQFDELNSITQTAIDNIDFGEQMSEVEKEIRATYGAEKITAEIPQSEVQEIIDKANGDDSGKSDNDMEDTSKDIKNLFVDKGLLSDEKVEEAENIRKAYEKMYYNVAEFASGNQDDWKDVYDGLSETAREEFKKLGVTDQKTYETFFGGTDISDIETQKKLLEAFYSRMVQLSLESADLYKGENTGDIDTAIKQSGSLAADIATGDKKLSDLVSEYTAFKEDIKNLGPETQQTLLDSLGITEQQLADISENMRQIFGENYDFSLKKAQILNDVFNNALESSGSEAAAKKFTDSIEEILEKNKIREEDWQKFLSVDWSVITDEEKLQEVKENWIQQMKLLGYEGADKMWEAMEKEAEGWGVLNVRFDFEKFKEKFDEVESSVEKLGDNIVNVMKDMTDKGEISLDNFKELMETMQILGENVYDYVDIDKNGKITATEDQLEKIYKSKLQAQKQSLINEKAELDQKAAELSLQNSILQEQLDSGTAIGDTVTVAGQLNQQSVNIYKNWVNIAKTIAQARMELSGNIDQGYLDSIGSDSSVAETIYLNNDETQKKVRDAIQSQITANETLIESYRTQSNSIDEELKNWDKYESAVMRDHNTSMLEAKGLTADATKAQEDYNKALDEYNDKLKNVNEKLKEYNELLYGTENRKSSLDYLYNYDEAIKSFNDEISRSKDLLDDAQTIDESTSALQRYADATHNLLVEERAKQEVLKAGLDNYADMIENHGVSYTDNETGKQIDVNFGDYVKKDERTGKYVIDQRLINEAKFSDEWKDYLEEQVSNYNKYSEDLLTSEDNVRKAEKEIQDLRKEALKNYAAMETEIAEALKSQYEEEVNTLKDKYDAMKDADDDYLDALQDAINKQRELRDSANAYEDLAEKEKKLALMQRDTSGGNATEVKDLEKEVEDDRQNLLDEAVDNIIDGLQELYESQQELRDTEIELKEALKDNTAFWNKKAEELAMSFDTAEEYAEYISSISKEYADMTLAQQQVKLNEYGETFTSASEYMALQAMDSTSQIGDYIVEKTTVTAEEVASTIASTAETFTTEVTRAYNETTKTFVDDMNKASEALATARAELADAYNKLCDCAAAADAAAEALRKQQELENRPKTGSYVLQYKDDNGTVIHTERISAEDYNNGDYSDSYTYWKGNTSYRADLDESSIQYSTEEIKKLSTGTTNGVSASGSMTSESKVYGPYLPEDTNQDGQVNIADTVTTMQKKARKKYATGGIVDYTGWAWVDGTPSKPEGFLNAEDTENIGNAARILADIPWLNMTSNNGNVTNNSIGGTSVVVNLNVDKITSEVDVEEMVEMVKDAVVEAANPMGTEVILRQSL